jgi:hypothetical protein
MYSRTSSGRLSIYVQFYMIVFPFEKQVQKADIVIAFECRLKIMFYCTALSPVVKVSV